MKRAVISTTGLVFLFAAPLSAYVANSNVAPASQNIADGSIKFIQPGANSTGSAWLDANGNVELQPASTPLISESPNHDKSPQIDSGISESFSVSEPAASSSGPAPTEAPAPRAGWIGLAGLLGVMAARWFSAIKRSRAKSAPT
jgi:hypothetical protein